MDADVSKLFARDAAGSPFDVMLRRLHFALFAMLLTLGTAPAWPASSPAVSGSVRDSAGVPQIGAVVQLLRPDMSVVATAYTSGKGLFSFSSVVPGRYAVKAMGNSFLPSLRENVRVRPGTVVNLTLNTLYEAMQWLPAEPKSGNAQKDDWAWTLRSAANRPLLRWLEDGPLVVVSEKEGGQPKLKARLMASGHEGTFGENGERITAAVEETPSNSRELLARVDFEPGTDAGMESMLGFRQELGFAGSVQSVAAVTIHPEIQGAGNDGLDVAAVRSWENIHLGDEFEAEVGAEQVLARVEQGPSPSVTRALPFMTAAWRDGDAKLQYRIATFMPGVQHQAETEAGTWLPAVALRDRKLAIEHGMHNEVGWSRQTDASEVEFLVFADRIKSPMLEAIRRNGTDPLLESALLDPASQLVRAAGQDFSSTGFMATAERRMLHGNTVRVSYANGDALVLAPVRHTALPVSQIVASARPRRAQMYSISLSGTLEGTGTHWQASYRWQPEETVTQVAPFAVNAAEPFMNLHLRQPVRAHREGHRSNVDVVVDVRNLLAEGYRPFVLGDGSVLVFAQDQRGVSGGFAFTF